MHSGEKRAPNNHSTHKHTHSGLLRNICSKIMYHFDRRIFMPKTHFNKVAF